MFGSFEAMYRRSSLHGHTFSKPLEIEYVFSGLAPLNVWSVFSYVHRTNDKRSTRVECGAGGGRGGVVNICFASVKYVKQLKFHKTDSIRWLSIGAAEPANARQFEMPACRHEAFFCVPSTGLQRDK